jgi:hypothetical protein
MTVRRQRWELLCLPLLVCSLFLAMAAGASAAKHPRSHRAHVHRLGHTAAPRPRVLLALAHLRAQADRALVADAKRFTRCLDAEKTQPRRCKAAGGALQRAGGRLARVERRLARVASSTGRAASATSGASHPAGRRTAPRLSVSGGSLSWAGLAGIRTYVLRRRVPGQGDFYTVVHGRSATPPAVPGATVSYAVRTTARWSFWSVEAAVSYPSASLVPSGRRAAPTLTISGQTLSWTAIPGVSAYIVVRSLAGHPAQYSAVTGASFTMPAVLGATAHYRVRSAVAGSAWATATAAPLPGSATASSRAAAVRAAARAAESLPSSPAAPSPSTPSGLIVGVDTGNWRGSLFNELAAGGIRNLRVSDLSSTAATEAEAAGCSIAVLTFQAGGTIGGRNPATYAGEVLAYAQRHPEVERIEALNEPELLSDSHNYSGYVALLKATHEALASLPAASRPKLLASWAPTYGFGKGWAAAGGLPYVDEVVVHAYGGGTGQHKGLEGARELVAQAHAESGKPVAITEVGWPTAVGQPATGDSQQWSEAQQAAAITGFAAWAHTQPYISVVIFFNAVDYGSNMWYGIERTNRSHKPSFAALAAAAR